MDNNKLVLYMLRTNKSRDGKFHNQFLVQDDIVIRETAKQYQVKAEHYYKSTLRKAECNRLITQHTAIIYADNEGKPVDEIKQLMADKILDIFKEVEESFKRLREKTHSQINELAK